jgi:hypothetical protein
MQSVLCYHRSFTTDHCTCMALGFARCLEAPSNCEAMNCSLFSLHANPVLPAPGTQFSFLPLRVPLPIPLKWTVWRNAYIIHATSNWALRHRLVVSHITKHSLPLNSVARSHILLHGILLWLTGTAARDHIMIHQYCGTSAYYDSPVLGKGSHYDSSVLRPVLSTVSYYDSYVPQHGILLWLTCTAALDPIMTHGYHAQYPITTHRYSPIMTHPYCGTRTS